MAWSEDICNRRPPNKGAALQESARRVQALVALVIGVSLIARRVSTA